MTPPENRPPNLRRMSGATSTRSWEVGRKSRSILRPRGRLETVGSWSGGRLEILGPWGSCSLPSHHGWGVRSVGGPAGWRRRDPQTPSRQLRRKPEAVLRIFDENGSGPAPLRSAPRAPADIEGQLLRHRPCLADDKGMGIKDIFGGGPTEADRPELERLVGVVSRGLTAWAEAGLAIRDIKHKQLWRLDGHKTWELWCEGRLGVSARRVLQLEQAAAFGRELAETMPTFRMPTTPASLEPLAGLETAAERADAYMDASTDAGGEPTREQVKRAVAKRKGKTPLPKPRRYRVPGATVRVEFNRRGNGSALDALTAALKLAEDELERLAAESQTEAA